MLLEIRRAHKLVHVPFLIPFVTIRPLLSLRIAQALDEDETLTSARSAFEDPQTVGNLRKLTEGRMWRFMRGRFWGDN